MDSHKGGWVRCNLDENCIKHSCKIKLSFSIRIVANYSCNISVRVAIVLRYRGKSTAYGVHKMKLLSIKYNRWKKGKKIESI